MKKTLWILLDDRMGSVGQAKGIALALEGKLDIAEKQLVYNRWAGLPNWLRGRTLLGIDKQQSSPLDTPLPDMVLSTSRRTLPVARWIRKKSGGKTKIIQLMYSGKCGLREIELVIVPEHDRGKSNAENIFYITGCPHRTTPQKLDEARQKWEQIFQSLPQPLTAVLVGGAIKGRPFSIENARELGRQIRTLKQKEGGAILITTSRRTGRDAEAEIMKQLEGIPAYTYLWGEKKENPFMGFLACANKIIVTGDSVSMCSDACGTGKPVLVFEGKNWLTPKHHRFVHSLYEGGFAIAVEDTGADCFQPRQALQPSAQVAEKILEIR